MTDDRVAGTAQPVIGQKPLQPFARAVGIAGDDGTAARFQQRFQMAGDRLIHIGLLRAFGRKVAGGGDAEIDGSVRIRLCKGCQQMRGIVGQYLLDLIAGQVEHFGRQGAIAAGLGHLCLHPVVIIVGNGIQP